MSKDGPSSELNGPARGLSASRALLGCGMVAALAVFLLVLASWPVAKRTASSSTPRAALAGQEVPAHRFDLAFDQKYDLHCQFNGQAQTFRNSQVLGFTGRDDPAARGGAGGFAPGPGSSFSSSAGSYGVWFEHWLVIALDDGRKAFIPPHSVLYIEEADPAANPAKPDGPPSDSPGPHE